VIRPRRGVATSSNTVVRALVLGASFALGATLAVATTASADPTAALVEPMSIVAQGFELGAQDTWSVTFTLPAGLDATTLGADGSVVDLDVRAYGPVTDRKDVARIRDGRSVAVLHELDDTFAVPLALSAADAHVTARPAADQVTVAIPIETVQSDTGLLLPVEGVYPIELAVTVNGAPASETITFVHRHSAGDPAIGDLPVALLMAQTAAPSLRTDGSVALSDAEHADLTELTESLEAMDAATAAIDAAAPTLPRATIVQPATLQALGEADPELAARLVAVLERSEVLAAPKLPLDPSSVVAAGLAREQIYTDWLRAGEDIVSAAVPGIRTDRSLYLADAPLSDGAAGYLSGTGVDAIVMSPQLYKDTAGSIRDFGDPTWLQTIELTSGATVPVLRIDPYIGERLDATPAEPLAAAIDLMAEVLAYRQFLDDQHRLVSRSGLLLARSDGGAIDPAYAAEIARLLVQVDGLEVVTPGDLVSSMDKQLVDGSLGTLTMPASAGPDLSYHLRAYDIATFDLVGVRLMLPDGDPHVAQWQALIDALPSTALTDQQVATMSADLQAGFDEFRNGVQGPAPFAFTLTGRTGTIRFRIHNNTDTPLTVMVRLAGAKLTFPVNDVLYTIDPQGQKLVTADAESKSNGTSQVIVRILTPSGTQIVPDVALTARVRALTGLGQLITGAGLLVLLTWWVRHWRLSRRRNGAAATTDRHPAVRATRGLPHIADDPDDPPDAVASSLPPS